jgi:hypothetical protein
MQMDMFTIAHSRVVLIGKGADPLSVQASFLGELMAVLLIILLLTIALAMRAGVWGRRRWSAVDSETEDDTGLIDNCARTLTLVLMSLIGLFALGVASGNVLGTGAP